MQGCCILIHVILEVQCRQVQNYICTCIKPEKQAFLSIHDIVALSVSVCYCSTWATDKGHTVQKELEIDDSIEVSEMSLYLCHEHMPVTMCI